jgi:hypothetical protein
MAYVNTSNPITRKRIKNRQMRGVRLRGSENKARPWTFMFFFHDTVRADSESGFIKIFRRCLLTF